MTATPRHSEATRAAILASARRLFAAHGFDRATIRAIAADARIDTALVMRYFGSKDRLLVSAAEFDLRLSSLAEVPADRLGHELVRHAVTVWAVDGTFRALLRAAMTQEAAAQRMRAIFTDQLAPALQAISGAEGEATERAGLVASQILGMMLCRQMLLLPPVVNMSDDDIVHWLGPTLQRCPTAA